MLSALFVSLLLLLAPPPADAAQDGGPAQTHIFFSAGCADCWPYAETVLIPALQARGLASDPELHDYTAPAERRFLLELADSVALPRSIADSLYAFVPTAGGTLVILGHVPPALIDDALVSPNRPERLVLWQPEMHGAPTEYRLWAWAGEVSTFPIDTPFEEGLAAARASIGPLPVGAANLAQLLPAVIVTGLLDSVNPCAFAVILLLIAFLFTLRKARSHIRVGAWILIGLGMINLVEYFFPSFPLRLHMPAFAGARAHQLIKQATLPATVGAGILVGLCTFPCSGGIYVSVITLLNAKTTLAWGVSYLALYNVMFVLPLIVILLAAGNRVTAKAWASWERQNALNIRLWYGVAMVSLGAIVLLWLID
jgi:cytochrome c biogenesis protein CcdA